ncbi:MAG TPA: Zn-ribbon domain-containing OB-fold protein [Acidimicrobiales bacterium]|nr:Zn-ribbon domain-containing OB-fold protein [Acidimicrobiales bacterium]
MSPGPLPADPPHPSLEDMPFWEAARQDRLVLSRCRPCGNIIWYPRAFCPACGRMDVEWVESPGRGTVYSFTVSHRGGGAWREAAPYVIAYVELEEGPRVLTNIVECDPEALAVGDRVEVVFQDAGDWKLPRFRPC